jgi:hypothetical protein
LSPKFAVTAKTWPGEVGIEIVQLRPALAQRSPVQCVKPYAPLSEAKRSSWPGIMMHGGMAVRPPGGMSPSQMRSLGTTTEQVPE